MADTANPPFAMPDWPAFNTERRKLADIKKNPRNTKKHPPEQIDMVRASMREFGWTMPMLVDEKGMLIAGEGRLEAALLEGIEEGPVVVARGWSDAQKRAYLEADNNLTEQGVWDNAARKRELLELKELGFPMLATGWTDNALERFLAPEQPVVSLAERFGVVPFSVFRASEGPWQDRKRAWLSIGLQSEVGRGENLLKFSDSVALDGKAYNERFKGANRPAQEEPGLGGEV